MKGFSALSKLATRSVIKQFANKYHLVYFGGVDARSDDHQLVRGVTAAATHTDNHYTVGEFNGRDLILVERNNVAVHPGKPTVKHHWMILQLDLKRTDLPHVFMDSHHGETFHANLSIAHSRLRDVTSLVPHLGHVTVLAPVERLDDLHLVFTAPFAETTRSFNNFDYEINEDQLFVYAHNPAITITLLSDMLRVGAWLADHLDSQIK